MKSFYGTLLVFFSTSEVRCDLTPQPRCGCSFTPLSRHQTGAEQPGLQGRLPNASINDSGIHLSAQEDEGLLVPIRPSLWQNCVVEMEKDSQRGRQTAFREADRIFNPHSSGCDLIIRCSLSGVIKERQSLPHTPNLEGAGGKTLFFLRWEISAS